MKEIGLIRGSKEQAVDLIIGVDTVYVHTDIQKITIEDFGEKREVWQYREIQYDKNEYIEMIAKQDTQNKADIEYMSIMADIPLYDEEVEDESISISDGEEVLSNTME